MDETIHWKEILPPKEKRAMESLINELKQTQRELVSERDRLKAIGDNLPNGALIRIEIDLGTYAMSVTYLSATWPELTGLALEKSLGDISGVFKAVYPDDLPELKEKARQSVDRLTTINAEFRFFYKKSEVRWLQLSSHPHREGNKVVSDGFISDITERKIAQHKQESYQSQLEQLVQISTQELRESNEKLEALNEEVVNANEELSVMNEELQSINEELYGQNQRLEEEVKARKILAQELEDSRELMKSFIEQSFEGIVIVGNEGQIIEWNRRMEEMTGIRQEEAIGQYEWDILSKSVHKEDPKKFAKRIYKERLNFLENCEKQVAMLEERIFRLPDGTLKHLLSTVFSIALADSCFMGIIVHDNTERKKITAELEQYRTHLEQMVEQKTCELRSSREQLVTLSNNLPEGIILQLLISNGDISGMKITFISDTIADLFGIDPGNIMESAGLLFSLFPDDTIQLFTEYFSGNNTDPVVRHESKVTLASGETKWIHIRLIRRIRDEKEHIWEGYMIDITQRKNAELKLEEIRIKQDFLIDIMQIIQFSPQPDEAIHLAMSKMGSFLNLSRIYTFVKTGKGDTLKNNYEWCNEGIHPEIGNLQNVPSETVKDWFEIFDSGRYIRTSDIRNLSPEAFDALEPQGIKALVVFPLVNNGANYGFIGFEDCLFNREWEQREIDLLKDLAQVISESLLRNFAEKSLKRSMQTLRRSEEMHRSLILASPYAIIMCDAEMNMQYASPKTKELLKITDTNDLKGVHLGRYVHPHDRKQLADLYDKIIREDLIVFPTLLLIREDKTEFFAEVSVAPVKNDDSKITSVIVVFNDITRRKNNEIELIHAKEKAEESDRLKSAFLANMSHEIRTPLNGILGFLNFLSDDRLPLSRKQEFIGIIRNSSNQLVKIIDDVIDLSKIEARQLDIHPAPFRLNDLMNEIYGFFESYIEANNKTKISLLMDNNDFPGGSIIYGDPIRLRQVLTNLIGNAIKFTEKGYVRIGYKPDSAGMLEFEIEDTGIGLNEKQITNAFDRFWQAEKNNTRNYGGTGLGLTISKNLVQLMGGEITVVSLPGKGSTFRFTMLHIPVFKEDAYLFKNMAAEKLPLESQQVILFVEPSIIKYKYYEDLLSSLPVTLLYAADIRQWMEHISKPGPIDMAFVNSEIFGTENNEISSKIKAVRAELPVVLIAGNDMDHGRLKNRCTYCEIIREPVNHDKLCEVIEEILIRY